MTFTKTFSEAGGFAASRAAEAFLMNAGFSIGSSERGAPRGVMFGDWIIAKWRNMNRAERAALHGRLEGDGRNGPVTFYLAPNAPLAVVKALQTAEAHP